MTDERLAEIQDRADKATLGPWYRTTYERYNASGDTMKCASIRSKTAHLIKYPSIDKIVIRQEDWYACPSEADMEFIAHAREDIPALLQELAQLRWELYAGNRPQHPLDTWLIDVYREATASVALDKGEQQTLSVEAQEEQTNV